MVASMFDQSRYVPAQCDPATPAPVLFFQDGAGYLNKDGACRATIVLDNLIAAGEIPPTVAVFLNPGTCYTADGSEPTGNYKQSSSCLWCLDLL